MDFYLKAARFLTDLSVNAKSCPNNNKLLLSQLGAIGRFYKNRLKIRLSMVCIPWILTFYEIRMPLPLGAQAVGNHIIRF